MEPRPLAFVSSGPSSLVAAVAMLLAGSPASAQVSNEDSTRIARVEHGLLPAVALRGRRDTTFTIGERLRRYNVPGMSVAVIDRSRLAWARGYGVTDAVGAGRVDTATLFQAGSISKAVTAVAAMRMVERGTLRLDEDVDRTLVSWKAVRDGEARTGTVTLRNLLSHGAGFNLPSFGGYAPGVPLPTLRQVLDGVPPANTPAVRADGAPGEWRYSGGGFTVIQQLLVDASGQAFSALLQRTVLDPAGLSHSTFEHPLPVSRAAVAASGHRGGAVLPGRWLAFAELAAAGLWSTAPDLARFGIGVLHAWRGDPGSLFGRAAAREMLSRQLGSWGLGFALSGTGDSASFGHDGSTAGYTARLVVFPATGQGLAVMTNGESEALIEEVVRSVAREYDWPVRPRVEKVVASPDPAGYATLAGRYRVMVGERAFDFVVSVNGPRLMVTGPTGRPVELLPESELQFFIQDSGYEYTFTRDGQNPVTSMVINQQGERYTARRLSP